MAGPKSLQVWSLPDGKQVFSESASIVRNALLEVGDRLLIGRADGTVTMVETARWQRRQQVRVHSSAIDRLTAINGGASTRAFHQGSKIPWHRGSQDVGVVRVRLFGRYGKRYEHADRARHRRALEPRRPMIRRAHRR